MKFLIGAIRIFVGILALIGISFLFPPFGQLVALSIICTAGITLFFWLPAAYVMGGAIIGMISSFGKHGSRGKDQRALEDYICREKAHGVTEEEIMIALKGQGWAEEQIKEVMDSLRK